ncbi:NAD(P)/FAD-dependent oxidoreductase [Flavilitoribacter nigricans]|uniref:NADH:ubiquinone reductase (non-electrogenic) n=1 Tax=Flavilitoribacter nigricans (strain ATCC 23147 / DSM 23189 / NBRC 102662 / NCIMB 1420 / SS-2) TaxID=1122177 RepID=A0A2D0NEW0_FLAN2|nr:NAD(P)/FAD-dependent oxidoreductase [Flavilitoribacter nigricans]PHN06910.1 FAD-dependent oxidoreductase [Flavilitoribacter nigricans DSM 23189 = NBRC 102662]
MKINIPETDQERIVIVGGGFGGLTLARKLAKSNYQIVLIDRNNFHQFQPLFYQVAMAGLEPSSILFPLRKTFHRYDNVYIRVAEVTGIKLAEKRLETSLGICNFDHLIIATGADTNFFGNQQIADKAIPMKSVSEALFLRNTILNDYEIALSTTDFDDRQGYIDIVIVGGGPTGVEVAGALAEMRKNVLPKDYPELDCSEIDIYLVQSSPQLLKGMSEAASEKALEFLTELGVKVILNNRVVSYDGEFVEMKDGSRIQSRKVIWAAGITGSLIPGLPEGSVTYGNRLKVNRYNEVEGVDNVYALGDIAYMEEEEYPQGHPQVAQVAIQQAKQLADNFKKRAAGKEMKEFSYRDLGSMATIGRRLAVVDLPNWKFQGTFAWFVWLFVHLFAILGSRNKLVVFINWVWNYLFYDQSLRLIIRTGAPWKKMDDVIDEGERG